MSRIVITNTYPHPREAVWEALTTREALAEWLMPNDFEPRVGHRFTFRTDPAPGFDGIVRCEVLRLDAPTGMAFTWVGGPIDTVVTFTLDEVPEGTRLTMEQDGFAGPRAWLVSRMLKSGGREIYGKRLRDYLNGRHPGRDDACMNRPTRFWVRLTRALTGRRDR